MIWPLLCVFVFFFFFGHVQSWKKSCRLYFFVEVTKKSHNYSIHSIYLYSWLSKKNNNKIIFCATKKDTNVNWIFYCYFWYLEVTVAWSSSGGTTGEELLFGLFCSFNFEITQTITTFILTGFEVCNIFLFVFSQDWLICFVLLLWICFNVILLAFNLVNYNWWSTSVFV